MKNKIAPVLFFVAAFLILYLIGRNFSESELRLFIDKAGVFGPIVFILLLLLTLVIAPFSGTPILYAGFFAYGAKVIILAVVASYLSFVINFWIARKWGRRLLAFMIGSEDMEKIDNLAKNYGKGSLIVLRVFQGSVNDFVSFAAGLTNMKFMPYLIISIIASTPGNIIWYLVSLQADTAQTFTIAMVLLTGVSSVVFVAVNLAAKNFKKYFLKRG